MINMAYNFYIDGVKLPIAPPKLQTKINNNNKTMTLINDGEVNLLKAPGLTEINFEVLLPSVKYPFAIYENGFKDPSYFLNKFETLKANKKPFQFIVSRVSPRGKLLFDTNIKVSIEEYTITEDAKNGLDIEVSVKLKQYRDYGTKVVKLSTANTANPVQPKRPVQTAHKVITYKVVNGDCLCNIAKRFYGNEAQYPKIFNANRNILSNTNLIYPGQSLVIP